MEIRKRAGSGGSDPGSEVVIVLTSVVRVRPDGEGDVQTKTKAVRYD